jgi:hypothetical protein
LLAAGALRHTADGKPLTRSGQAGATSDRRSSELADRRR